jgi:indole-3-glycerol phosphate synthase
MSNKQMFLEKIIQHKKEELPGYKNKVPLSFLKNAIKDMPVPRDFSGALKAAVPVQGAKPKLNIIAEVKKASPSKGIIREDFNPLAIAQIYEKHGAVAISVLTDNHFFQGNLDYLKGIKAVSALPLLDKDFIIDPYQIYQARYYGADAILLIAAVLTDEQLLSFLELADQLGLSVLVEVHTLEELNRVLVTKIPVIGINNRDLTNFKVTIDTSLQLVKYIPEGTIVVSESGLDTREDLLTLYAAGFDAFLIGEALMKANDIAAKLNEFIN